MLFITILVIGLIIDKKNYTPLLFILILIIIDTSSFSLSLSPSSLSSLLIDFYLSISLALSSLSIIFSSSLPLTSSSVVIVFKYIKYQVVYSTSNSFWGDKTTV